MDNKDAEGPVEKSVVKTSLAKEKEVTNPSPSRGN